MKKKFYSMNKSKLAFAVGIALGLGMMEANSARAASITATLTADNHYGLYYGQGNGSGLTFVGRNELGGSGSPGVFNWSLPETYNFNVGAGDYLYVLAWDDGGQQSWLGEFQGVPNNPLLSNTTDWEYFVSSGNNPGEFGTVPSLTTVAAEIASATWAVPLASAPQGAAPWGTIPGISSSAQFVWHDTLSDNSSSDNNYVIFRAKAPVVPNAVPEPTSALSLLALGILGATSIRKCKHKQ
jgi:PEP-CTERM motif